MLRYLKRNRKGFTLIELLIVVAIIGIVAAIAIANLQGALRRSRYSRSAADTKQATTQAVTYANDNGVYPTSIKVLRESGYANVSDNDPWGVAYQLSPTLTSGSPSAVLDDVYIYSRGASGAGTYNPPVSPPGGSGSGGSVGYSSVYGSWTGE